MISPVFIYVGISLNVCGTLIYALQTIKGVTQPNRITWMVWALGPLIAYAAQRHAEVGPQALLTLMAGIDPLLIFVASFVNPASVWHPSWFDVVCGTLALTGLLMWAITNNPLMALWLSIIADAIGGAPTIRKAYIKPYSETATLYALAAISATMICLTIRHWSFAVGAFAVYLVVLSCTIGTTIILRRCYLHIHRNRSGQVISDR